MARAKNTAVDALVDAGIAQSTRGRVSLKRREDLPTDWDPAADSHLVVWETVQHLIHTLEEKGEEAAADLLAKLGGIAELARDLAYRLYVSCERKSNAEEARAYNTLVVAWPDLQRLVTTTRETRTTTMTQQEFS